MSKNYKEEYNQPAFLLNVVKAELDCTIPAPFLAPIPLACDLPSDQDTQNPQLPFTVDNFTFSNVYSGSEPQGF